jgi:hypothetical protein
MTKIFRVFGFRACGGLRGLVYPSKSNASTGERLPPAFGYDALKEGSSRSQIQLSLLYAYSTGSREKLK